MLMFKLLKQLNLIFEARRLSTILKKNLMKWHKKDNKSQRNKNLQDRKKLNL